MLDKFGGGLVTAGTQLVGDLLGSAFLFKKLALCFGRPPFGLGGSVRIADDRIYDPRVLNEKLLIKRYQLEQQARFASQPADLDDRRGGGSRV